jgi:hypothetical protein
MVKDLLPYREKFWRKLHVEDLHNLYSSLNIIGVIKSNCSSNYTQIMEKCLQNKDYVEMKTIIIIIIISSSSSNSNSCTGL